MSRIVTLGLLVAFTACESGPPKPEEPIWGKQQCAHCSMLVSEKPPAAQALREDGARKFFDDVGCLVAWEDRVKPQLKARWVRGPGGEGWVAAEEAKYSGGHVTPMDFGFLADSAGVSYDEVRAAVREKARPR
jgi:nitrous oxide reductase accessory protein NosL